ncbi:MAG: hypothetical protein ACI3XM_05210 [Eubacteriales bacterium]
MKNFSLTTSVFPFVFFASLMCACGNAAAPQDNLQTETVQTVPGTETEKTLHSGVPDVLDLQGRIIRIYNSPQYDNELYLSAASEETGDAVNDAVYHRNLSAAETLNVRFDYIDRVFTNVDIQQDIRKFIAAGDDAYDLILGPQWKLCPLVTEALFWDMSKAPYIDVSAPWWADAYITNLNIGNQKRYFLTGDITLQYIRNFGCVYFNKALYTQIYDSADALYDIVLDGKWTLDKVTELTKDLYLDLNGNNKQDEGDRYGYGLITATVPDHLFYSAGAYTCIEENGQWVLDGGNARSVAVAEKVFALFHENPSAYVYKEVSIENLYQKIPGKFAENEYLFMFGLLYFSDFLRDMTSDYGIIPYPKYDEDQESYKALVHDPAQILCVPVTASDTDELAAVLEEMAFCGYQYMTPEYYNVALKQKYMRDSSDKAMCIIDLIHDASFSDVGFIYNYAINKCGLIIRDVVGSKQNTFVSTYEKSRKAGEKGFNDLISLYSGME